VPSDNGLIAELRRSLEGEGEDAVLYAGLARALKRQIGNGMLDEGAALPSERTLSDTLGLSRETVRKAIALLTEDGVLAKRHGSRTTVAGRIEKPLASLNSFSEDMRSRGIAPGALWLMREVGPASPHEVMALNLSPSDLVCRLHRVRTGDGRPIAIERATVPAKYLPDPLMVTASLYEVLDQQGARPVRALQRLRAAIATPEDAGLLDLAVGAPLLVVERRCFTRDNQNVELTETRYCGARYDFVAELRKGDN
jgi:GntR family transcriptional regulator